VKVAWAGARATAVAVAAMTVASLASASPPDLVLKTETFLEGPDVIAPRGRNLVYTPTAPQNHKLIVLFPGSALIGKYESFMSAAAAHGYHVLALDSPLTVKDKGDACAGNVECRGRMLRQAVDGDMTEAAPFWSEDYPQARYPQGKNAIIHRLIALLDYVKHEHQGSGQFLICSRTACEPDWTKIVVAGHGKGGAIALWLLKRHHTAGARAFLFSGPSGYVPLDPAWRDALYVLDNASDPAYAPSGSVGAFMGQTPREIPSGIRHPECHGLPESRFLLDVSPGGADATLEDGAATDAARCAWDLFLALH